MLNTSDILRGYTDTIILAALLKGDSYGYEISKNVRQKTENGFDIKEATLYTTFRRLEQGGYITSYWGDEASGARRRYYSITESGKALYNENCNDWSKVKHWLDILLF